MEDTMSPVDHLPMELVFEILSKLKVPDLLSLSQADPRIFRLLSDDRTWRALSSIKYPSIKSQERTWRDFYINVVVCRNKNFDDFDCLVQRIRDDLRYRAEGNKMDTPMIFYYDLKSHDTYSTDLFLAHSFEEAILKVDDHTQDIIMDELSMMTAFTPSWTADGNLEYYFVDEMTDGIMSTLANLEGEYRILMCLVH